MFFRKLFILSSFLILLFGFEPRALSYNFLYINPTTGAPIGWEPGTTIHYYVDPGSLGRLTNEQARTLIRAAMDIWENASPYADTPRFVYEGLLPEDVNASNYQNYVSHTSCNTSDLSACPTQIQRDLKTVIIFDEQGTILSNEFCTISDCSAWAGDYVFSGTSIQQAVQGLLIIGPTFGSSSVAVSSTIGTMVHELGHLLGLAHTSVNQEVYINSEQDYARYMPTMFFSSISLTRDSSSVTLHPDDIAGIITLYPKTTASDNLSSISGQILKSDSTPMMHVNVIARSSTDPLCEAVSYLSGRICPPHYIGITGSNCFDTDGNSVFIGNFTFNSLVPNIYTLESEEIADDDLALTFAPGLLPRENIYGDAEFWNTDDVADELNTLKTDISLTAGEAQENIDIILNRSEVTSSRIKYIPLSTFTPGPGTRCPENPTTNYADLIGISEAGSSGTGGPTGGTGGQTTLTHSGCSLIIE